MRIGDETSRTPTASAMTSLFVAFNILNDEGIAGSEINACHAN
jgi:hypothetical protein